MTSPLLPPRELARALLGRGLAVSAAAALVACDGPQSALDPAGRDASQIAALFSWMAAGALVVWVAVLGSAIYAMRTRARFSERAARLFILGGGVVTPTLLLTALLVFGLSLMPDLIDDGAEHGVTRVRVSGEQWWWRVRYELPDGAAFELANEVRVPVAARTPLFLESPDVIHSFWIPALAGKRDMIPGRVTRLALEPTRAGAFRGACAEYCGLSHARMSFVAVAMEPPAFVAWLAHQAEPAAAPSSEAATRGAGLFHALGCGACHTIRGTEADGVIGPDLTHVGSRLTLGAGVLDNDVPSFARWLARTEQIKPGVHMPAFGMLPRGDLLALSTFLEGLE